MTTNQEIVLITGSNTGIGLEIARKLLRDYDDRFYVLIGGRTMSKVDAAVQELHKQNMKSCEGIQIEVTKDASIDAAARVVKDKFGRLDVLHVNAGIAPDKEEPRPPISQLIMNTMSTNVAGAAATVEAFVPLLQKSDNPRVVFMSTGLASLTRNSTTNSNEAWPAYSASKAALNMIMLWYWRRFPEWKVNACSPGFRATALNNFGEGGPPRGAGKLEDGAVNAVRLTLLGKNGESGTHTEMPGGEGTEASIVPW